MTTSIVGLHSIAFDIRVALGGVLINIDGTTYECKVSKDSEHFTHPTYTVRDSASGNVLCTFRPYHVHLVGGPNSVLFSIEGASQLGSDATLIVPLHDMQPEEENELSS